MHIILTTFYHMYHLLCSATGDVVKVVYIVCNIIYYSSSQPGTSTSKQEETGTHLEEFSDESASSEEAELSMSESSMSKLSSERGFSPIVPITP